MTLSVGLLCQSPYEPGRTTGLILASDTRYSWADGRTFDHGEKVFEIGAYAGCAAAATNATHVYLAVEELRTAFGATMASSSENARVRIHGALAKTDTLIRRRGEEPGYHLIISLYAQNGDAVMAIVGDDHQVANQPVSEWGAAIGLVELRDAYGDRLKREVIQCAENGTPALTPEDQASVAALTLYECVTEGLHHGIGGGVQVALITPERGYDVKCITLVKCDDEGRPILEIVTPPVGRNEHSVRRWPVPVEALRVAVDLTRRREI